MHESCGVFGVYYLGEDVARLTYFALFSLQHLNQVNSISLADGNIINAELLHKELAQQGNIFRISTDTEKIDNLIISYPGKRWIDKIRCAMHHLQETYSLCLMTRGSLFAVINRNILPYLSDKHVIILIFSSCVHTFVSENSLVRYCRKRLTFGSKYYSVYLRQSTTALRGSINRGSCGYFRELCPRPYWGGVRP